MAHSITIPEYSDFMPSDPPKAKGHYVLVAQGGEYGKGAGYAWKEIIVADDISAEIRGKTFRGLLINL